MRDWKTVRLEEYLTFRNGKKSPEREPSGCFTVYGSNGIIGFCSMNNTSANTITIGRVGVYCGSVYFSSVPSWVTDNAIIAEPYSPAVEEHGVEWRAPTICSGEARFREVLGSDSFLLCRNRYSVAS